MTPIAFTLTLDDMVAGNRLAFRRYVRNICSKYALSMIAVSLGVTLIAFAARPRPYIDALVLFAEIFAVYAILSFVLGLLVLYLMPKQRAKKNMKQMRALSLEQTVSWDDKSIAFTSGYGNICYPLADLHQWAADDGIVILYPADHLFYMLPSRVFTDKDVWGNLIGALEGSLVRRI